MGEYSNGIDRINIELSISNKLKIAQEIRRYLIEDLTALHNQDVDKNLFDSKKLLSLTIIEEGISKWEQYLSKMDHSISEFVDLPDFQEDYKNLFEAIQSSELRITFK